MKDKVLIIDGLDFIYRGVLSGQTKLSSEIIIYNFFRNLKALIHNIKPDKCFFALEGNPKFRKELFNDYKRNRIKIASPTNSFTKVEILEKSNIIYELIKNLPITTVKANNYEGDDVIFTLVSHLENEDITIISSDSDLIQILQTFPSLSIELINPRTKNTVHAPNYVYLVWKSLAGDNSDNIPGLVSANKAEIIASSPSELAQFLQIEENRANFSLNKSLIQLSKIPSDELIFNRGDKQYEKLFSKFSEMKFNSLLTDKYKSKFMETFNCLK